MEHSKFHSSSSGAIPINKNVLLKNSRVQSGIQSGQGENKGEFVMDEKFLESSDEAAEEEPNKPLDTYIQDLRKTLKPGDAIRNEKQ